MAQKQGILKKHPSLTDVEFSAAWKRHGQLVTPYLISYGCRYYAQIHGPLSLSGSSTFTSTTLPHHELESWSGAAETKHADPRLVFSKEEEAWREAYYKDVILEDERRFLVSPAGEHLRVVDGVVAGIGDEGGGKGEKVVFIRDGKAVRGVDEGVLEVWRRYERGAGADRAVGDFVVGEKVEG